MVAGGYNSKDFFLKSVEFMDLGETLSNIPFSQIKWRNLPEMKQPRSDALILINDKYVEFIIAEFFKIISFSETMFMLWVEILRTKTPLKALIR